MQYGLHPERDPIAVPFEAKGVPHGQSEFGHPDAAIGLTCLAFYYAGTSKEQLRESLKQILNSEDPAAEFDRWTGGTQDLPDGLQWNTINVDDEKQTTESSRACLSCAEADFPTSSAVRATESAPRSLESPPRGVLQRIYYLIRLSWPAACSA